MNMSVPWHAGGKKLSPGGDAPLVRPVPFLPERFVKQAAYALGLEGKVFCIIRF